MKNYRAVFFLYGLSIVFSLISLRATAQPQNVLFRHYQSNQGLASNNVHDILQDDRGYIWIATNNGLSRFDGYSFTNFFQDDKDPNSIPGNFIYSLYQDSKNRIWIATQHGAAFFSPESQSFTCFKHDPDNSNSLSSNMVKFIIEGPAGHIWMSTNKGLNKYDPVNLTFAHYNHDPNDPQSISSDDVNYLCVDSRQTLWIGTIGGGLNRFNPDTGRFIHYRADPDDANSLKSDYLTWLKEDSQGNLYVGAWDTGYYRMNRQTENFHFFSEYEDYKVIDFLVDREGKRWISTWDNGLYCEDPAKNKVYHITSDEFNPGSLSSDSVTCLREDRSGMVWIGTLYGGINVVNHNLDQFVNYTQLLNAPMKNLVYSIYEDRQNILWIGAYKEGLIRYDRQSNTSEVFTIPGSEKHEYYNSVLSILEDRQGRLLLGSFQFGLHCFDPQTKQFLPKFPYITDGPMESRPFWTDSIRDMLQDRDGSYWLTTDANGLLHVDEDGHLIEQYFPDSNDIYSLSHPYVTCLLIDSEGTFWLGTDSAGLHIFDRKNDRFTRFQNDPADPFSISNDGISFLMESSAKELWIGTVSGLNRLDRKNRRFERFLEKDGLTNNKICSILEDKQGNLWISTNSGISKFNPKTGRFKNYDINDGLIDNEFVTRGCWKNDRGEMFFGSKGILSFFPENIKDNRYKPPIVFTDFSVMGKPLPSAQYQTGSSIEIQYQDKFFSFGFSALDFTNPFKNQYEYMLEGFDEGWIPSGNRRYANYTNLNPGHYMLRVKGTNNDGFGNEKGALLQIIVHPPFWMTRWFRVIVVTLFASLWICWYLARVRSYKREQKILREKVEFRTQELSAKNAELERTIAEREKAMKQIKILSGFIPICANCKNVRSDEGYWNQIEEYISEHSEADFTHSICPSCAKKLYPDYYDRLKNKPDEPLS